MTRGAHGTDKLDLGFIETNERVVTVVAKFEGFTGYGTAIRDDHDKWVPEVGYGLAMGRALCDLGSQLKRSAWDKVPQRAPAWVTNPAGIFTDEFEFEEHDPDTCPDCYDDGISGESTNHNDDVAFVRGSGGTFDREQPWYERVLGHLFR